MYFEIIVSYLNIFILLMIYELLPYSKKNYQNKSTLNVMYKLLPYSIKFAKNIYKH